MPSTFAIRNPQFRSSSVVEQPLRKRRRAVLSLIYAGQAATATATSPQPRTSRTRRTTCPRCWLIFRRYDDSAAISPRCLSHHWLWSGNIFRQGDLRLSSGEALKKTNSVGVLSNSSPVLASPFAPGGLARTRRRRPRPLACPARATARGLRRGMAGLTD